MTTPVRSPLRSFEPPPKGSSTIRNNKEIASFKESLARIRKEAAGQPAARDSALSFLQASPLAATAEGLRRPDCDGEAPQRRGWEAPTTEDEKGGEAQGDDHRTLERAAPSMGCGAFVDQLVPTTSGVGQAEHVPRFGSLPVPIAEMWTRLVRRVALGGDGRRATARIEIGAGEWAGAAIVVHAVEREITLEIDLPAGARVEAWRERIADRLRARGLELAELTVR